jgi:hypothetical protein
VRLLMTAAAAAAVLVAAGCTAGQSHDAAVPGRSPASLPADPQTAAPLLKIATAFNNEYGSGDYGPVYARWDARSQALIGEADYIRRHKDCPGLPQPPARTETATPGPHGAWMVRYRRWVFDLVLSNPDAVRLYRLSPQQYVAAVGCSQ